MDPDHIEHNSYGDWLMRNMAIVVSGVLHREGLRIGRGGIPHIRNNDFILYVMFNNMEQNVSVRLRKVDTNGNN